MSETLADRPVVLPARGWRLRILAILAGGAGVTAVAGVVGSLWFTATFVFPHLQAVPQEIIYIVPMVAFAVWFGWFGRSLAAAEWALIGFLGFQLFPLGLAMMAYWLGLGGGDEQSAPIPPEAVWPLILRLALPSVGFLVGNWLRELRERA